MKSFSDGGPRGGRCVLPSAPMIFASTRSGIKLMAEFALGPTCHVLDVAHTEDVSLLMHGNLGQEYLESQKLATSALTGAGGFTLRSRPAPWAKRDSPPASQSQEIDGETDFPLLRPPSPSVPPPAAPATQCATRQQPGAAIRAQPDSSVAQAASAAEPRHRAAPAQVKDVEAARTTAGAIGSGYADCRVQVVSCLLA